LAFVSCLSKSVPVLVIASIVAAFGCSGEPRDVVEPTPAPSGRAVAWVAASTTDVEGAASGRAERLFPLEVGNLWEYEGGYRAGFQAGAGPVEEIRGYVRRRIEIVGIESAGGSIWMRAEIEAGGGPCQDLVDDLLVRQDRSGFYQAEGHLIPRLGLEIPVLRDIVEPAPRASLDPEGGDPPPFLPFALLQYPLAVGKSWTAGRPFVGHFRVEGREALETPAGRFAAWRIRIQLEGFDPRTEFFAWFGRDGYLGFRYWTPADAEPALGDECPFVGERWEFLSRVQLVGRDGGAGGGARAGREGRLEEVGAADGQRFEARR